MYRLFVVKIGVKQAAELLDVSDKTIYRWVSGSQIPFYRVGSQYRFSRSELLSWTQVGQSSRLEDSVQVEENSESLSLEKGIRDGGIFYRVGGRDAREVFEQMLGLIKLPSGADTMHILDRLCERERIITTGMGDGIAFPHCRDLFIPGVNTPIISLGFLETPVDFAAIDKKPVNVVFMMLSPTASVSIRILSRLAHAVRQPSVSTLLSGEGARDQIFEALAAVDRELNA